MDVSASEGQWCDIQLVLDNQRARSHDRLLRSRRILNNNNVITLLRHHIVELLVEPFLCDIANRRQDPQAVEETGVIVGFA